MSDDKKSFWATLPGVLTGLAAVISAVTGLYIVIDPDNGEPLNPDPPPFVDSKKVADLEESRVSPNTDEQTQPSHKPRVNTVQVRARGSISHGFFTPKGYVVMMAQALGDSSDVTVSWMNGNIEKVSKAKVHTRSAFSTQVAFLQLIEDTAPKARVPIRNSATLRKGEKVERFLSEHDRAPGTVLDVGKERNVGGGVIRRALVTTKISGPGDSGAPVVDSEGNIVAMVYGGSQTETISVPIEEIKASLFEAF